MVERREDDVRMGEDRKRGHSEVLIRNPVKKV